MNFEVFIHKLMVCLMITKCKHRDIPQRPNDDLADAGLEKLHLNFISLVFMTIQYFQPLVRCCRTCSTATGPWNTY